MVKYLILSLILFSLAGTLFLHAQEPSWIWAVGAGGVSNDNGWATATDDQGNLYVTGTFRDTATFGNFTLESAGNYDIFVAKLDPDGNFLWVSQAGGTGADHSYDIVTSSSGNSIYIAGCFKGTSSFGNTTLISTDTLFWDGYVAKLNGNGGWLWAKQVEGNGDDVCISIDLDYSAIHLHVSGNFQQNTTIGSTTLVNYGGSWDIFVARIDQEGNWEWAAQAGGINYDVCQGIAVDNTSFIYITGYFSGVANFGSTSLDSGDFYAVYVAKLSYQGEWQWALMATGSANVEGYSIAVDSFYHPYVVGKFAETAEFGIHSISSNGNKDVFIARADPQGFWLWVDSAGGQLEDRIFDIAVDSNNFVYATGSFQNIAEFGNTTLTSSGLYDIFVIKLDRYGNWIWAKRAGGTNSDIPQGIAVDNNGNSFITGYSYDTLYFDSFTVPNLGDADIFIARLGDETEIGDELIPMPDRNLMTISPNPFHLSATLRLDLSKYLSNSSSEGIISIYNLKGSRIKTITFQSNSNSEQTLLWDGRNENNVPCPGGIYFIDLRMDGKSLATKKVSLIH